jgi:GalNAc-alpha-(1->4)-GalNAc-alpha-(1->3)-diNAcBac-PP-undecaprenol alpha-1,4-N-acetyl-D-galactosaminyltransferase
VHRSRLRVTCVIHSLDIGGAQRNILRLAAGLDRLGHVPTLMTLDPFGRDFYGVPTGVIRVRANPAAFWGRFWANLPAQFRRYRALRASILETQPDVVISFIDTTNIDVLIALCGAQVPVIVSERVDPRFHPIGGIRRILRWLLYPLAAKVVLVARGSEVWSRRFIPRWNITVIDNPVVAEGARNSYKPEARTVVAMGRLAEQKGFDLLIDAFALIARDVPEWGLKIIGEGPARGQLEDHIRRHDLGARIELAGACKDPAAVMAGAAFFVLSSRYEGFPMALAEAMAQGLPVVSYDCPSGPRELVRPGVDGLLVPAQDVQGLASAMRRMMENPELRQDFSHKAIDVLDRFPLSRFMSQWSDVIQEAGQAQS